MVLIPKNRLWLAVAATLLAAFLGAVAGYLHGTLRACAEAENTLTEEANLGVSPFLEFLRESDSLLAAMHRSKDAPCSPQEIVWFRQFLFQAKTIRDVGRMGEDRVLCSALYGRNLPRRLRCCQRSPLRMV